MHRLKMLMQGPEAKKPPAGMGGLSVSSTKAAAAQLPNFLAQLQQEIGTIPMTDMKPSAQDSVPYWNSIQTT
eukprot:4764744-Ditylum_brightwellii.AAC.1